MSTVNSLLITILGWVNLGQFNNFYARIIKRFCGREKSAKKK